MAQLSRKHASDAPSIPDRLYFKIGDVAKICGVQTYVLRFWETQFPQLKPNKSGTGQRLYRRRDVELALEIKQLVHEQGYTLAGARQTFEQKGRRRTPAVLHAAPASVASVASVPVEASVVEKNSDAVSAAIGHARAELRAIADTLAAPVAKPARRRARVTQLPVSSGSLFPL